MTCRKGGQLASCGKKGRAGPGTQVYDLLRGCASTERHFFYAGDDKTLKDALNKIATEATSLRLTN
ncbi:MAG: hypothetical protein ACK4MF_07325 [Hyphomicrobiaceae bacterium]